MVRRATARGNQRTDLEITPAFGEALRLMDTTSQNLFITGKAGTGKSTLLAHFRATTRKSVVVLAPTGVAALNVRGQTVHSFFHFPLDVTPDKIARRLIKPRDKALYKKITTIIVDEVSMLRADILDSIATFLSLYGPRSGTPFGGVQMVFIGDLYQLPPVVPSAEREIFQTHYTTPYFFSAHAFTSLPLTLLELEKIYRQKDADFIDLLNRVRNNTATPADLTILNARVGLQTPTSSDPSAEGLRITLTATNRGADAINTERLALLKGRVHTSGAIIKGQVGKDSYPTATELTFKVGAQIMLLNNDSHRRWVNGSLGVVKGVGEDDEGEPFVRIRLAGDDEDVEVYPFTWEIVRFGLEAQTIVAEPVGTFTQYPFRLAWAVTIHKSQGQTFDHVALDVERGAFAPGQTYVALSRCTSFEGLSLLRPLRTSDIRTDFNVRKFLANWRWSLSAEALPTDDKVRLLETAIREGTALAITYLKPDDTRSERTIRPLSVGNMEYKGKTYLGLRAFCLMRHEERTFRVDRILSLATATGT